MDISQLLKAMAPTLGAAVLGPFGAIAASFIAEKIGVPEKTVKAVTEALSVDKLTSDQVAQVKLAEIEFKKWMSENDLKQDQLAVQNTQGARDMQVATRSFVPAAISLTVVFGYFAILVGLMFGVLHVTDNQSLLILIGALSTAFGGVLNFWLGSSHGSQAKNEMLANSTPIR